MTTANDEHLVSDDELLFDQDLTAPRPARFDTLPIGPEPATERISRPPPLPLPLTRLYAPAPFTSAAPNPAPLPQQPTFSVPPPPPANAATAAPTPTSSREQSPLRAGEVLAGKYRVHRLSGRVGLGIVAHVRHIELGQRLLLKCLPQEIAAYPDAVTRFLRGARSAMQLQSEHTSRTLDAGRLPSGAPYVVSEALSGCDLREVLRVRGQLGVTEAVDFVLQACESVAEAHLHGLLHRSLNLTNLFTTRRPDGSALIKVLDFGVADLLRGEPLRADDSTFIGFSPFGQSAQLEAFACCSPEQIRGFSELDARTDVWALGAILHELLSGYAVYQADSAPALLAMIAADPAPPVTSFRSDVPTGLESAILRCLEKDRNARFPTLADFATALKPFASAEAEHAVDRITRTLGRSARPSRAAHLGSALIHVGPSPNVPRAIAAEPLAKPGSVVIQQRTALIWSTALVAFGLVGGSLSGVLMATRGGMTAQPASAPAALVPQTHAAQPAAAELRAQPAQAAAAVPMAAVPVAVVPVAPAPGSVNPNASSPAAVPAPAIAPPTMSAAPIVPVAPRPVAPAPQRVAASREVRPQPTTVARRAAAPAPASEADLFDGMN